MVGFRQRRDKRVVLLRERGNNEQRPIHVAGHRARLPPTSRRVARSLGYGAWPLRRRVGSRRKAVSDRGKLWVSGGADRQQFLARQVDSEARSKPYLQRGRNEEC